jgi:hypothetical protein
MQTNQATWRMLGGKLRDLMPVNAEVTCEVRLVPTADLSSCSNESASRDYSITSSARASSYGDTVIPNARSSNW